MRRRNVHGQAEEDVAQRAALALLAPDPAIEERGTLLTFVDISAPLSLRPSRLDAGSADSALAFLFATAPAQCPVWTSRRNLRRLPLTT